MAYQDMMRRRQQRGIGPDGRPIGARNSIIPIGTVGGVPPAPAGGVIPIGTVPPNAGNAGGPQEQTGQVSATRGRNPGEVPFTGRLPPPQTIPPPQEIPAPGVAPPSPITGVPPIGLAGNPMVSADPFSLSSILSPVGATGPGPGLGLPTFGQGVDPRILMDLFRGMGLGGV